MLAKQPAVAQAPPALAPIRVGLPVPQFHPSGELFVQPNVVTSDHYGIMGPDAGFGAPPLGANSSFIHPASLDGVEPLPPPADTGPLPTGLPETLFSSDTADVIWGSEPLVTWDELHAIAKRPVSPTGEPGLGRERVMYAPFEIDITQPFGNFLLRADAAYNLTKPDRAEYFWARPGRGPILPESGVAYQDFHFRMENGGDAFSIATDIPIRLLNPDVNDNTGGIGDIQLVQKTRLMNGSRWQMTQILRTIFNSGNARKGLGTGHVAMEPGLLCRFKWNDITYLHSEVLIRFPIAGDPMYSGPAWTWGLGVSTVWYETDTFAVIPTLEFVNTWIIDGQVTPIGAVAPVDVRGDGIFNLGPGLRTVWDTGGDMGVVEMGANAMLAVGSDGWYDALVRFDLRFVF